MKTLYLVRHAKSSWNDEGIKDWQRSLLKEGIERANRVSEILKKKGITPDRILTSYAFRAINTALIFSKNKNFDKQKTEISDRIYGAEPSDVLLLIKKQADTSSSLMLFGHNPTFTELFNHLSNKKIENLSTSAVGCIKFRVEKWSEISPKTGEFLFLETGK